MPGPKVTIRDIAKKCGVGVTTVSRALNDQPGVSDATKKRVLDAVERLNYSPNLHAKSLRAATSKTIVVVLKGPSNPFFLEILDLLEAQIRKRGFTTTIVRVEHDKDEVQAARQAMMTTPPAGLILLGGWIERPDDSPPRFKTPFVHCTVPKLDDLDADRYSSVAVDDTEGLEKIVQHLRGLGHERIAFLGSDVHDRSVGALRERAFRRAMAESGAQVDDDLIMRGDVLARPYSYEFGAHLMSELLDLDKPFTAAVAASDVIACGAIREAADRGLRVPDDISVTGFDGIELGRFMTPRLTTLVQPTEEIASATCDALWSGMDNGESQHILLPGELRVGESSGPVAK